MDSIWWTSWCNLDWESEYGPGWQQETLPHEWRDHKTQPTDQYPIWGVGLVIRLACHSESMRHGVLWVPVDQLVGARAEFLIQFVGRIHHRERKEHNWLIAGVDDEVRQIPCAQLLYDSHSLLPEDTKWGTQSVILGDCGSRSRWGHYHVVYYFFSHMVDWGFSWWELQKGFQWVSIKAIFRKCPSNKKLPIGTYLPNWVNFYT